MKWRKIKWNINLEEKEQIIGEWIYGYLFKIWDECYILWGATNNVPNMIKVIPETIGQYTGLKDKNGKEIYKGDVWEDEDGYYIIAWDEKYACFSVDVYGFNQWIGEGGQECYGNKIEFLDREGFEAFIFTGIEITKNIYDNP